MNYTFFCPACREPHAEPADATFVLTVLCLDCELQEGYRDRRVEIAFVQAAA